MGYFSNSYRVLFSDTMALGWHHFLTNFKFQCEAREHFFFGHVLRDPKAAAAMADLAVLTNDGYSRNLAQVPVGGVVGILTTYEERGPSSVRACFRVIRADGVPVACGYQKLVCFSVKTGAMILSPPEFRQYDLLIREKLVCPSFAERVNSGVGLESIFDDEAIRLGKLAALGPREGILPAPSPVHGNSAVVFAFPGTGSAYPELLAEIAREDPSTVPLIREASAITRNLLGAPLTPCLDAESAAPHLERFPELVQIVTYLGGVLTGRMLFERGFRPACLVGHSVGEIAALAVGGAFPLMSGVEVVAQRVRALRPVVGVGAMLAVTATEAKVRSMIVALGPSTLDIAVVNGPDQVVVSGAISDVERLDELASHLAILRTRLNTNIPYHGRLLKPCVEPWTASLSKISLNAPTRPVYSPMERGYYGSDGDLARVLPSQFVRPLQFTDALADMVEAGARVFVECGGGNTVTGIGRRTFGGRADIHFLPTFASPGTAARNLSRVQTACRVEPVTATAAAPKPTSPEPVRGAAQIAVIGMGCVLPGAFDPPALWKLVLAGKSSITAEPPEEIADYLADGEMPVSDKTYSPMRGKIEGFAGIGISARFGTSSQRYLAEALRQALAVVKSPIPESKRIQLLIGSTADGCREYEEALLTASLVEILGQAPVHRGRARQIAAIEAAVGRTLAESHDLSPWVLYEAVSRALLGPGVRVLALDAACASSLYSVSVGVRALEQGECDLALAGGVFAPGAANSCLFAQFRGLSRTGSRPLDVTADGVVFSEGSGILALKRLQDAQAAGDRVLAVIQGVGLSSDGRSPSVMEPREAGQLLSLRRAYRSSEIDPATVQYLEAHATATVVGDAVEVKAAGKIFAGSSSPITLGSVKANFGHTGWAAGVTSLIKMISAMEADTIPPQAVFTAPSPKLEIEKTVFEIPTKARPWQKAGQEPRRVAVNGFGFGGANAHVVVEAPGTRREPAMTPRVKAVPIAVVAIGALFPSKGTRFGADEVGLPPKIRILPDILDHMDRSNVLAIAAAAQALAGLPGWQTIAEDTGVTLGIEGKTGRGLDANLRIHRDRLQRKLAAGSGLESGESEDLRSLLNTGIDSIMASGPYTLPGLMPNVVAGRVTAAFDFKGPNLVVDAHRASLFAALELGSSWLRNGETKAVLAGALHGHAHPGIERLVHASVAVPESRPVGEACVMVALTTEATAREMGWPIHAFLECQGESPKRHQVGNTATCLMGAEGAHELVDALSSVRAGGGRAMVSWPGGQCLTLAAATEYNLIAARMVEIEQFPAASGWLEGKHVLAVAAKSLPPTVTQALSSGASIRTVTPAGSGGDVEMDLTSEATLAKSLEQLEGSSPDLVLVVRDLAEEPLDSVCRQGDPLMELAFAISRRFYEPLGTGKLTLAFLCKAAWPAGGQLHPATGLFAGFGKSLAGELPGARVRIIYTEQPEGNALRECLERELASPAGPVEVAYRRGKRMEVRLVPVGEPTVGQPLVGEGSVVLAVGGARGVTAVLVEGLLERFHCTVAVVGRSDPSIAPAHVVDLEEGQLPAAETDFIASEMASQGVKPAVAKARWERIVAAREVVLTLRKLQALPGRVVYVQADVTVGATVDEAVKQVTGELGKIDFVLYGAGVQVSKLLVKRSLDEFRRVLGTKLIGLGHVEQSLARHQPGRSHHVHLVSSATGLLGAPGAQDYAAANEVLNRLAVVNTREGYEGEWSSVAWTWWRGVGMGTAFDQLPAARRLPSLSREQGKQVFVRLMEGRMVAPVVSVFLPGDAELLHDTTNAAPSALARSSCEEWPIDSERYPFLSDHRVDGTPTMPGAYLIDIAVRSAWRLRPDCMPVRIHDVRLTRFVKFSGRRAAVPRTICRVIAEEGPETFVQVRFVSDFVHANGTILRRDDVHATVIIVLSRQASAPPDQPRVRHDRSALIEVPEPYQHPDSRVFVGGPFNRLGRIFASEAAVESSLRPAAARDVGAMSEAVMPVVPLDALFRLTTYEPQVKPVLPVFVPTICTTIYLPARKIDPQEPLVLEAGRRVVDGKLLITEWAEARDQSGRVVLRAENLVGLRVGQITVTLGSQERAEQT